MQCARNTPSQSAVEQGFAPLHTVVWCNQPVAAECFVHHSADLNAKDTVRPHGISAPALALLPRATPRVPTRCRQDGNTPIENARRYGRTELAAWLAMARARRNLA